MDRCQFCWDVAEALVDGDDLAIWDEYLQLYDHAHAQERLERNPHAIEAVRDARRELGELS